MVAVVRAVLVVGVAEDGVEAPSLAEVGRGAPRADPNAAIALRVDLPAEQQPEILGRKPRHVSGVVELAGAELLRVGELFGLEQLQLASSCPAVALESPDAGEDLLKTVRVAVGLEGRSAPLVFPILLVVAERLVEEGIVQRAAEGDDVLDVELRLVADEG